MNMRHEKHVVNTIIPFFVVLIACLALVLPGPALAAGKPESLHVAIVSDFSGPYAPVAGQSRPGARDAWEYINGELGGVLGVKVKIILKDMTGKVALGLSMYNELVAMKPKPLFIDTSITPLAAGLRERYVEDGIVGFHAGAIVSLYPHANSYAYYCLYPEQLGALVKYVKDNFKEKRRLRVGIITWDTSYGRAILVKPFFDYLKKLNVDLVETQVFGIREVDVTAQLMKLKAKNPDYLITNCAAGGALAIKKGCKEMGWDITVLHGSGSEWGTVRLDPPAFEGDMVAIHTKSFDETNDPSIKTIMKYLEKNKRTVNDRGLFYLIAWENALLEHKIMTDVVKKHGWKGLTAKNIIAALNTINDFAPLNGMTRITYSADRRTPRVTRLYKVTGGKLLPLTDFSEVVDMRPAKYR